MIRGWEEERGSLEDSHGLNVLPPSDWGGECRTRLEFRGSEDDPLGFFPFPSID